MPCSRGSSHPGMEPRSPALQVGSEPPAKPIQNYVYTYIIKKLYIYINVTEGRRKYKKDCYEPYGAGLESEVLKY